MCIEEAVRREGSSHSRVAHSVDSKTTALEVLGTAHYSSSLEIVPGGEGGNQCTTKRYEMA